MRSAFTIGLATFAGSYYCVLGFFHIEICCLDMPDLLDPDNDHKVPLSFDEK